jgi:THO complex subunit 5
MASADLIADPLLQSVLSSAAQAREQSLAIIDVISDFHASEQDATTAQLELSKQQKILNTHLAQLRGLNKKAVLTARSTKQETAEARQEIDSLHLQLQNLYYEQRHLRGEIAACEDYKHTYTNISMIPEDEFLALHPDHTESSEHDLTVARIEDEHKQRKELEETKQKLVKQKEGLTKETNAKKDELAKLDAEMEKWLAGQENVKKLFDARDKRLADAREKEAAQG